MSTARANLLRTTDDDVVIVSALRTPLTRARKGPLSQTPQEELLVAVFKGVISQSGVDPKLIEDISVGNVLPPGGGASISRMAALASGIPNTTPISTTNRQCSSGLTAVNQIANAIKAGQIDIGIGAGVESMSLGYGDRALPQHLSDDVMQNHESADCLIPMGNTSENVARDFKISREDQDAFAASSYQKAWTAQTAGHFQSEIVPLKVKLTDPKTSQEKIVLVERDDGVRDGVTQKSLSKLKPAFEEDGSAHAGNSSQVTDGAAAVLLARRSVAKKLKLPILGKFVFASVVGVPPRIMGVGPAYAIPKVLEKTGLKKEDVDFYEINEAFASQAIYCVNYIGLPFEKVNPVGGAIALGHPLGCTGARQIATGLAHSKRTGAKIFVTSMCMGSGMGMAAVFVSEQ